MKYIILSFSLLFNINIAAQISTFTELKAGMSVPGSNENISDANQQGHTFGFDLGINFAEDKSVGFSVNYTKNGFDSEVPLRKVLKKSNSTEMLQGSASSIFSVGIITRAENSTLMEFIHPYAKMFLGYSYITVSGFENQSASGIPLTQINENDFTAVFSLGLLVPVSESFSGFGIEGNYSIFVAEKDNKQLLSFRFLYRQNIEL